MAENQRMMITLENKYFIIIIRLTEWREKEKQCLLDLMKKIERASLMLSEKERFEIGGGGNILVAKLNYHFLIIINISSRRSFSIYKKRGATMHVTRDEKRKERNV